MPATTIGSTIASVLQFIVVIAVLMPMLTATTITGHLVLPGTYIQHFNGTISTLNNTYICGGKCQNATNGNSLYQQMTSATNGNANGILGGAGVLQTLGGLAFIPALFGSMMYTLFNIPATIIFLFSSIFSPSSGAYIDLATYASITIISGAIATYFVTIYALKLITPITKVEVEDV